MSAEHHVRRKPARVPQPVRTIEGQPGPGVRRAPARCKGRWLRPRCPRSPAPAGPPWMTWCRDAPGPPEGARRSPWGSTIVKRAPVPGPSLSARIDPPWELDHALRDGEAEAETTPPESSAGVDLGERLEQAGHDLRGDPSTGVLHRTPPRRSASNCCRSTRWSSRPRARELGGVVEQVADHLREPGPIAIHADRVRLPPRTRARCRPGRTRRGGRRPRVVASSFRSRTVPLQRDLAARDPRERRAGRRPGGSR